MKSLMNMSLEDLDKSWKQYQKLVKRDNMEAQANQAALPLHLVRGDINNEKEWQLLRRTGSDDIYPLSKAQFRNVHTGEVINGMLNEQDGSKLLGELIQ